MIKVSIRLDKRYRLKNGKFPVRIKIARKENILYLPTGYELEENEWDAESQKVIKRADRKIINARLAKQYYEACEKLSSLQKEGKLRFYSNKKLQDYLNNECTDEQLENSLFKTQFQNFVATKENANTLEIYNTTRQSIIDFCDYDTLLLEDIDFDWLETYVRHLKNKGNKTNTIATKLRGIKAVVNYAKKKGIISYYVFDNYKLPRTETPKRSLSVEQLRELYSLKLTRAHAKYRDIFFLMFLLMGINLVDLSRLTNIENGRVTYRRAKTGTLYDIKIEPEALEIIERYRGEEHLISLFDKKAYTNVMKRFEDVLKILGKKIGVPNLTTYWTRHSFATIAYEIGVPTDVIADCLGHKSAHRMTNIYIRKDAKIVDEANRKVIDYVLYNKR